MKKLGEIIKEVRRSKFVTQKELAKMIGVEFETISRIENGRINTQPIVHHKEIKT